MVWSRAVRGVAHVGSGGEAGAALGAATSRWRIDARPGNQRCCCLRGAQGTRKARGAAFGPAAQGVCHSLQGQQPRRGEPVRRPVLAAALG